MRHVRRLRGLAFQPTHDELGGGGGGGGGGG
eukprot:SAG22_NODE_10882_length_512_cov_0.731235_1_plen_30_part_10